MKKAAEFTRTSLGILLLPYLLARISSSYIEPGSTSFLLKILISGLAGIAVAFRFIWKKLRLLFSNLSKEKKEEDAGN